MSPEPITELIASVLREDPVSWRQVGLSEFESAFLGSCSRQGVSALVHNGLKNSGYWNQWPVRIRKELRSQTFGQVCVQTLYDRETASLIQALAGNGVPAVLIKGGALAQTHYPSPHLRPRGDTDLLIRRQSLGAARRALLDLGYTPLNTVSGDLVMYQRSFVKELTNGLSHIFDIHWRISNPQLFSPLLTFQELSDCSRAIPSLCEQARTPNPPHSLFLACLHRVAHHRRSDCLLWLYDIHLLVSNLSQEEVGAFVRLVERKRCRAVCLDGVKAAQCYFRTDGAGFIIDRLSVTASPGSEATSRFLEAGRQRRHILYNDLQSVTGLRNKLKLAREHLFPPADFMLNSYATRKRILLPILYLDRAVRGSWRILRGHE